MNERIQELAEQALENSLFETIEPTITVGEGANKVTIPLVFAEKFAELIVKECIDICEQTRYEGKVAANRIKFVFGLDNENSNS